MIHLVSTPNIPLAHHCSNVCCIPVMVLPPLYAAYSCRLKYSASWEPNLCLMSLFQAMPVSSTATGVTVPAMSAVTCIQPTVTQPSPTSNLQSLKRHLPTTRSHSAVTCIQLLVTELSPAYNRQSQGHGMGCTWAWTGKSAVAAWR